MRRVLRSFVAHRGRASSCLLPECNDSATYSALVRVAHPTAAPPAPTAPSAPLAPLPPRAPSLPSAPDRGLSQRSRTTPAPRPEPKTPSERWLRYLQALAYRSSSARERVAARTHAPGVEIALRQLEDFVTMAALPPSWFAALEAECVDDVARLERFLDEFERWFQHTAAPQAVNLEEPWEWYPKARQTRRRIIFHSGPTNSGKTHAALEALAAAKSGVYCAPLKALAAQVWQRLNQRVPCDLLIGDERQFAGSAEHVSCTVEMTPCDLGVDVAVIDEIQMIEDRDRGWAWTRALYGLPAREIHLCGEPRALPLIRDLLYRTRELPRLEVVEHKRLVPLQLAEPLRGNHANLRSGDCLVVFSRNEVFKHKKTIESRVPGAKVSIVYGGLPFAVRERETAEYNAAVERKEQRFLVATDAIAYGLNLNIGRVILAATQKFNGKHRVPLPVPTTLQVCGRAGRFGTIFGKQGFATTFHNNDFNHVQAAFKATPQRLQKAGLLPTSDILLIYAEIQPAGKTFLQIVDDFMRAATTSRWFFACDVTRSILKIAELLNDIKGLSLPDKVLFCYCPLSGGVEGERFLKAFATMHSEGRDVRLLIDEEVNTLAMHLRRHGIAVEQTVLPPSSTSGPASLFSADGTAPLPLPSSLPADTPTLPVAKVLQRAEAAYRIAECYCWLAWRFPRTFVHRENGAAVKQRAVAVISACLTAIGDE